MPEFELDEWLVERLRLSVFWQIVQSSPQEYGTGTWKTLTGEDPVRSDWNAQSNAFREEGIHLNRLLTVICQADRADVVLHPDPQKRRHPSLLPLAGTCVETVNGFVQLVSPWLENRPPISRIAFGATLLLPSEDIEDAYRQLQRMLPGLRIDDDMREVIYQVNRRRDSRYGVDKLTINRVANWSCITVIGGLLSVSFSDKLRIKDAGTQDSSIFCRLVLDINTDASFDSEIENDVRGLIFPEMVNYATEIASHGDIA